MISFGVVIPLYNKEPHIARALKSVLAQTIPPDEIIVVDDGSTDNGQEVVKSFSDPRIKLVCQQNQGESAARNRGIKETNADLIGFLDADDAWKPSFVETILTLKNLFPEAGAYATAREVIKPDNSFHRPQFNVFPSGITQGIIDNYFREALKWPVSSSSVAIPKKVLEEIGMFPVGETLGPDQDTWLRVALHYPIAWSSEYLVCIYENAVNRVIGYKLWDREPTISITARQAIESGVISDKNIPYLREFAAYFQVWAAFHCLIKGKREAALRLLHYSQGTTRFAKSWWVCRILYHFPTILTTLLLRTYGIYDSKQ